MKLHYKNSMISSLKLKKNADLLEKITEKNIEIKSISVFCNLTSLAPVP